MIINFFFFPAGKLIFKIQNIKTLSYCRQSHNFQRFRSAKREKLSRAARLKLKTLPLNVVFLPATAQTGQQASSSGIVVSSCCRSPRGAKVMKKYHPTNKFILHKTPKIRRPYFLGSSFTSYDNTLGQQQLE